MITKSFGICFLLSPPQHLQLSYNSAGFRSVPREVPEDSQLHSLQELGGRGSGGAVAAALDKSRGVPTDHDYLPCQQTGFIVSWLHRLGQDIMIGKEILHLIVDKKRKGRV